MSEATQQTLTGEEATQRERPESFVKCTETGQLVLRSRRFDWPHETIELDEVGEDENGDGDGDEESEPDPIGGWYDIRLSYSVDFAFRVVAETRNRAKERARDMVRFGNCADAHHVHTNIDQVSTVLADEVDDDYKLGEPIADHLVEDDDE